MAGVCCPTGGSSGNCRPLPRWQDRAVVLATGKAGRGVHHQRHRSGRRSRNARKAAFGQSTYDELRTDPHWPAQPASLFAGHAAETLRYAGPYLDVMQHRRSDTGREGWGEGSRSIVREQNPSPDPAARVDLSHKGRGDIEHAESASWTISRQQPKFQRLLARGKAAYL